MKTNLDIALLLIRVGLGAVFVAHGWDKISDMPSTISFFYTLGLPAFMAYVVAYVELLGGISMLIGVFSGWAGVFLAANMIGAMGLVKLSKGFLGGYEFDLMLFL
jgi:uncharacterized membrane protein YphA (DoxX/SURF4 family)